MSAVKKGWSRLLNYNNGNIFTITNYFYNVNLWFTSKTPPLSLTIQCTVMVYYPSEQWRFVPSCGTTTSLPVACHSAFWRCFFERCCCKHWGKVQADSEDESHTSPGRRSCPCMVTCVRYRGARSPPAVKHFQTRRAYCSPRTYDTLCLLWLCLSPSPMKDAQFNAVSLYSIRVENAFVWWKVGWNCCVNHPVAEAQLDSVRLKIK